MLPIDLMNSFLGIEEKGVSIDYKMSVTQGLDDFESQMPYFKLVMHPNNVSSQFRLVRRAYIIHYIISHLLFIN